MEIKAEKYVRKPLYVDAVQVTEENFIAVALWCQGSIRDNETEVNVDDQKINPKSQHIHVRVHKPMGPRQTKAYLGDWILYTDKGYKVYTIKAFEASFDKMEPPQKTANEVAA